MDFYITAENGDTCIPEVTEAIYELINKCGMCEVRYTENPVIHIDNSIVLHGEEELLRMILDPMVQNDEIELSEESETGRPEGCSSAVVYPLFEMRGKEMPM